MGASSPSPKKLKTVTEMEASSSLKDIVRNGSREILYSGKNKNKNGIYFHLLFYRKGIMASLSFYRDGVFYSEKVHPSDFIWETPFIGTVEAIRDIM